MNKIEAMAMKKLAYGGIERSGTRSLRSKKGCDVLYMLRIWLYPS
jgi:hypothetical protein